MKASCWRSILVAGLALSPAVARAQPGTVQFNTGGGQVIRNQPYSGEGVTTVRQMLYDGTRIERTMTATLHRDSAGRVRREQAVFGLAAVDPSGDAANIITIVDPVAGVIWTLNSSDHSARQIRGNWIRTGAMMPPPPPPPPPAPGQVVIRDGGSPGVPLPPPPPGGAKESKVEPLGTRTIEGVEATGTRLTLTYPAGQIGNDRPIEVTEERWESKAMGLLLYSRRIDPRTGEIEYRLTKVTREEPAADLFTVPPDYRVAEPPAPPPPPPPPPPGM